MNLSFSNVLIIGYHHEDDDNKTIYDYYDTTVGSSSSYYYVPWSLQLIATGALDQRRNQISSLSGIPGPNDPSANIYADFQDITFNNYEPDSSIHIILTGIDAGKHILAMSNHYAFSGLVGFGVHGTYFENKTENLDYFRSTDSTRTVITLPYWK